MIEKWVDVRGYEGLYEVSNLGTIKKVKGGKILKMWENGYGSLTATLVKEKVSSQETVKRVVYFSFNTNIKKEGVWLRNINKDKWDCRLDNIEIIIRKTKYYQTPEKKRKTVLRRDLNRYKGLSIGDRINLFDGMINNNVEQFNKMFPLTKIYDAKPDAKVEIGSQVKDLVRVLTINNERINHAFYLDVDGFSN